MLTITDKGGWPAKLQKVTPYNRWLYKVCVAWVKSMTNWTHFVVFFVCAISSFLRPC